MPLYYVNPSGKKRKTTTRKAAGAKKTKSSARSKATTRAAARASAKSKAARKVSIAKRPSAKAAAERRYINAAISKALDQKQAKKAPKKKTAKAATKTVAKKTAARRTGMATKKSAAKTVAAKAKKGKKRTQAQRSASAKKAVATRRKKQRALALVKVATKKVATKKKAAIKKKVATRSKVATRKKAATKRTQRTTRKVTRGVLTTVSGSGALRTFSVRQAAKKNPPSLMASIIEDVAKPALPIAATLYMTRFAINHFGDKLPFMDKLGKFQRFGKPALSGLVVGAAHIATSRIEALEKWRSGIMLGAGLNLLDSLIVALAPSQAHYFGLGDADGIYDEALGEYVDMGAAPIETDLTLGDYVEMGDYVQVGDDEDELVEEELGLEEELAAYDDDEGDDGFENVGAEEELAGLSGISRPIPRRRPSRQVPVRSFARSIPKLTRKSSPKHLYTGIFAGGYSDY